MIYETALLPAAGNDFGPLKGGGIVALHTSESGPNRTMTGARAVANWQRTNPGSYNKLIATDGVLTTVADGRIAGGINPASHAWAPKPWLYAKIPTFKVNDPNSHSLQLCFVGDRAWYEANGPTPAQVDAAVKAWLAFERRWGPAVLTDHGDFQTNRSDPGPRIHTAMQERYAALLPDTALPEDDVRLADIKHQVPKLVRIRANQPLYRDPEATQVHTPGVPSFDAELLGYVPGTKAPWLCRRVGADGMFMAPDAALDRSVAFVPAVYGGGLTQKDIDAARSAGVTAGRKEGAGKVKAAAVTAAAQYGA